MCTNNASLTGEISGTETPNELEIPTYTVASGYAKSKTTTITYKGEGAYAFAGCKGLKEVKLPSGVKRIEYGAFSDMNISEIVVPKSVDYIGNEAFEGIENVVKR